MGLDNAICCNRPVKGLKGNVNTYNEPYPQDTMPYICYWRKCWCVRGIARDILKVDNMHGEELLLEELKEFYVKLKRLKREDVEQTWGAIWTWKEFKSFNKYNLKNLKKAIRLKKKYGDDIIFSFIDSY